MISSAPASSPATIHRSPASPNLHALDSGSSSQASRNSKSAWIRHLSRIFSGQRRDVAAATASTSHTAPAVEAVLADPIGTVASPMDTTPVYDNMVRERAADVQRQLTLENHSALLDFAKNDNPEAMGLIRDIVAFNVALDALQKECTAQFTAQRLDACTTRIDTLRKSVLSTIPPCVRMMQKANKYPKRESCTRFVKHTLGASYHDKYHHISKRLTHDLRALVRAMNENSTLSEREQWATKVYDALYQHVMLPSIATHHGVSMKDAENYYVDQDSRHAYRKSLLNFDSKIVENDRFNWIMMLASQALYVYLPRATPRSSPGSELPAQGVTPTAQSVDTPKANAAQPGSASPPFRDSQPGIPPRPSPQALESRRRTDTTEHSAPPATPTHEDAGCRASAPNSRNGANHSSDIVRENFTKNIFNTRTYYITNYYGNVTSGGDTIAYSEMNHSHRSVSAMRNIVKVMSPDDADGLPPSARHDPATMADAGAASDAVLQTYADHIREQLGNSFIPGGHTVDVEVTTRSVSAPRLQHEVETTTSVAVTFQRTLPGLVREGNTVVQFVDDMRTHAASTETPLEAANAIVAASSPPGQLESDASAPQHDSTDRLISPDTMARRFPRIPIDRVDSTRSSVTSDMSIDSLEDASVKHVTPRSTRIRTFGKLPGDTPPPEPTPDYDLDDTPNEFAVAPETRHDPSPTNEGSTASRRSSSSDSVKRIREWLALDDAPAESAAPTSSPARAATPVLGSHRTPRQVNAPTKAETAPKKTDGDSVSAQNLVEPIGKIIRLSPPPFKVLEEPLSVTVMRPGIPRMRPSTSTSTPSQSVPGHGQQDADPAPSVSARANTPPPTKLSNLLGARLSSTTHMAEPTDGAQPLEGSLAFGGTRTPPLDTAFEDAPVDVFTARIRAANVPTVDNPSTDNTTRPTVDETGYRRFISSNVGLRWNLLASNMRAANPASRTPPTRPPKWAGPTVYSTKDHMTDTSKTTLGRTDSSEYFSDDSNTAL